MNKIHTIEPNEVHKIEFGKSVQSFDIFLMEGTELQFKRVGRAPLEAGDPTAYKLTDRCRGLGLYEPTPFDSFEFLAESRAEIQIINIK